MFQEISKDKIIYLKNLLNFDLILTDNSNFDLINSIVLSLNLNINIINLNNINISNNLYLKDEECYLNEIEITNENYNDGIYLMFTSGSSGNPKAIIIDNSQVVTYIDSVLSRYKPTCEDNFAQIIDLTFDLSIHEIFLSLSSGSCLCIYTGWNYLNLPQFIIENKISFWLSAPSCIILLKKLFYNKEFYFPSLKVSLFCGEILTNKNAIFWHKIAINSIIENIYGPTEATIAFTFYRWSQNNSYNIPFVPIGKPIHPNLIKVINPINNELSKINEVGELYLGGPQISKGYFSNIEKTKEFFLEEIDSNYKSTRWYKSGDLVKVDESEIIHYVGRIDDQWQIRGQRVEKNEIELLLKKISKTEFIAILPIYDSEKTLIDGVIAFIYNSPFSKKEIFTKCNQELDANLIPKKIIFLDSFPLNKNGKTDYNFLKGISI